MSVSTREDVFIGYRGSLILVSFMTCRFPNDLDHFTISLARLQLYILEEIIIDQEADSLREVGDGHPYLW